MVAIFLKWPLEVVLIFRAHTGVLSLRQGGDWISQAKIMDIFTAKWEYFYGYGGVDI